MRISEDGLSLITHFEGCHKRVASGNYVPYKCPAGLWTVGYGTLIGDGKTLPYYANREYTLQECKSMLADELRSKERGVLRLVRYPLMQHEFDALVSFAYNLGLGCLQRSTLRQKLNRGDKLGAIKSLLQYNKAKVKGVYKVLPGLKRRREAEAMLFLSK